MANKIRFHKGMTSTLRTRMRMGGIAVDEEIAQRLMAQPRGRVSGLPADAVASLVYQVFNERTRLMRSWTDDHPGRNPYPLSFAERVLELARQGYLLAADDDGDPGAILQQIEELARAEIEDSNYLPGTD